MAIFLCDKSSADLIDEDVDNLYNCQVSNKNGDLMDNKKKTAAAISGVISYIKTKEEATYLQQAGGIVEPAGQTDSALQNNAAPFSLWGLSGRQDIMQMRSQMQMKAFHSMQHR